MILDFMFSAVIFCDLCKLYIVKRWLNEVAIPFVSRLNGAPGDLTRLIVRQHY